MEKYFENGSRLMFLGEVKTSYIKSNVKKISESVKVSSSRDAYNYLKDLFVNPEYEESVLVIYLNNSNRIIGHYLHGTGGITGCLIDPRKVFSHAINLGATGIIISHNHPSGVMEASQADKNITSKLKQGGTFLEIQVLDHIIVSGIEEKYYSFADERIL